MFIFLIFPKKLRIIVKDFDFELIQGLLQFSGIVGDDCWGLSDFCSCSEDNRMLGLDFNYVTVVFLGAFSDRYGRAQSGLVCLCGAGILPR